MPKSMHAKVDAVLAHHYYISCPVTTYQVLYMVVLLLVDIYIQIFEYVASRMHYSCALHTRNVDLCIRV